MRTSRVLIGGWKGPIAGAKESEIKVGARKRGNESTEAAFPPSFYDLYVWYSLKRDLLWGN